MWPSVLRLVGVLCCLTLVLSGFSTHAQVRDVPYGPYLYGTVVVGTTVTIQWEPVTGAGTILGYQLEAGRAPGATDAGVFQLGPVTSITADNVAHGIYYVRVRARNAEGLGQVSNEAQARVPGAVPAPPPFIPPPTPTPPPNPTPTPTPTPTPARVEVVQGSVKVSTNGFGDTVIVGEAINRSETGTAAFVRATATLLDSTGETIGTSDSFVLGFSRILSTEVITDTTLAPGETGCFKIVDLETPAATVDTATVRVTFDSRTATALSNAVSLVAAPTRATSAGRLRLTGQARNAGSGITFFNRVAFSVRGADGTGADCGVAFITGTSVRLRSGVVTETGLLGGESAGYSARTDALPDSGAVRAWMQWDEGRAVAADTLSAAERALAEGRPSVSWVALYNAIERERYVRDWQLRGAMP